MPISIAGSGTITGISAGGLPDDCITTADIAAGAVTPAKTTGGPAFSAYANAGVSVSTGTFVKIPFQVEVFDTASCYDNTTNYRFTPNVAGYYQVTARTQWTTNNGTTENMLIVHKNGSEHRRGFGGVIGVGVNALVYLNGTTDYIEIYGFQSTGGTIAVTGLGEYGFFQAALVRPA